MIAGGGFAMMAWGLAQHRRYKVYGSGPFSREWCSDRPGTATAEFYRILDRATYAWQHNGIMGYGETVRL